MHLSIHFLSTFSDRIKNASNAVLLLLMLMAVYSHYMVNDKFERIAPALVSVKKEFLQSSNVKSENLLEFDRFFAGILLHADGTTSDRLATKTRRRATDNGKRSRRQDQKTGLNSYDSSTYPYRDSPFVTAGYRSRDVRCARPRRGAPVV